MGLLWKLALFTNRTLSAGEKSSFTAKVIYQGWRRIIGCGAFSWYDNNFNVAKSCRNYTLLPSSVVLLVSVHYPVLKSACDRLWPWGWALAPRFQEGFSSAECPLSHIESVDNQMVAGCHATYFRQCPIFMTTKLDWVGIFHGEKK